MIQIRASADASQTIKQIESLERSIAKSVVRKSAAAGGQAGSKQAKALCPIRDQKAALKAAKVKGTVKTTYKGGQLKKSISYKVKSYAGNLVSVAIIGPRSGFRKQIGVYTRGGTYLKDALSRGKKNPGKVLHKAGEVKHKPGEPIMIDPEKYAHLVVKGAKGTTPHDFLTPAGKVGGKVAGAVMSILADHAIAEAARA